MLSSRNFPRVIRSLIGLLTLPLLVYLYLSFTGALQSWSWRDARCLILQSELQPTTAADEYQLAARVQLSADTTTPTEAITKTALAYPIHKTELTSDRTLTKLALFSATTISQCFVDPLDSNSFLFGREPEQEWAVITLSLLLFPAFLWFYLWFPTRNMSAVTLFRSLATATWAVTVTWFITLYSQHRATERFGDGVKQQCRVEFKASDGSSLVYSYVVNGKQYRSNDVRPFGVGGIDASLRASLAQRNIGDTTDCLVSKNDPLYARLDDPANQSLIRRALACVLVSLTLGLLTWRTYRRNRTP